MKERREKADREKREIEYIGAIWVSAVINTNRGRNKGGYTGSMPLFLLLYFLSNISNYRTKRKQNRTEQTSTVNIKID